MTLKDALRAGGLALTIIGALVAFFNTPKEQTTIDGGDPFTDHDAIEKAAARRGRFVALGIFLTVLGASVQFSADYAG